MATLSLPRADGTLFDYTLGPASRFPAAHGPITSRIGFAAVHVVADPLADINPTLEVKVDWDATIAYRATSGRSASRSRKRWIPRSAGWAFRGRPRRS